MINPGRLAIKMLTDQQIKEIHQATLTVLAETGVIIDHPKAKEILTGIGCKISDKGTVLFPANLVEDAIKKAPANVNIYSRTGNLQMELGGYNAYYGTVTTLPHIADINGNRREYVTEDCRQMTVIMDYLDSLDFATGTGNCSDVSPKISDVHEISCMMENSPKPLLITTHDEKGLQAIMDICAAYKGSIDNFKKEPFVIYCTCPISPLKWSEPIIAKMLIAFDSGLPYVAVPSPMAGATSPITTAGTLVSGNAEILSALVLAQTITPGLPFLFGGFFTSMDMASMIITHGSPEINMFNCALAEMARHYQMPSFSSAGCTDSHELDLQTGFECGMSTFITAMCGANLIHAISVLGSGTAVSREMLVLNDDFITFTERFFRGIDTSKRSLAVDDIATVGPSGSFLESPLTLDLFKQETWFPKIFIRDFFDKWVKEGKKTINQRLADECDKILATHTPEPVEKATLAEITKIIQASNKERL